MYSQDDATGLVILISSTVAPSWDGKRFKMMDSTISKLHCRVYFKDKIDVMFVELIFFLNLFNLKF